MINNIMEIIWITYNVILCEKQLRRLEYTEFHATFLETQYRTSALPGLGIPVTFAIPLKYHS